VAFTLATERSATAPPAAATGPDWTSLGRPSPLTAAEERIALTGVLARRFNPAMAFPHRDLWPVDVRYSWHDGADLVARVIDGNGRPIRQSVAVRHADLGSTPWAHLPSRDADGNRIQYVVDAPGDDRPQSGMTGWRRRWHQIVGDDVDDDTLTGSRYPPTQYAHLFWLNRERGLLGVQYWFYYPFNEWINRHEGDWEHIDVILQGPSQLTEDDAAWKVAGYQFYFHGWSYQPSRVLRVGGAAGDDHVVVFTGGHGRFLRWSGSYSGGSYPLPALFPAVGAGTHKLRPAEDTRRPQRFIAARDFTVVVLPEPERLDARATPHLSWLRLDFFAGNSADVHGNPFLLDWLNHSKGPPLQPGHHRDWNRIGMRPVWRHAHRIRVGTVALPKTWARQRLLL